MTLIELLKQIRGIESRMLTTEGIPLKMYGKNCDVNLKLCGDNGNYWVEVRSSIDHDEKVAIIMQMFDDGSKYAFRQLLLLFKDWHQHHKDLRKFVWLVLLNLPTL